MGILGALLANSDCSGKALLGKTAIALAPTSLAKLLMGDSFGLALSAPATMAGLPLEDPTAFAPPPASLTLSTPTTTAALLFFSSAERRGEQLPANGFIVAQQLAFR